MQRLGASPSAIQSSKVQFAGGSSYTLNNIYTATNKTCCDFCVCVANDGIRCQQRVKSLFVQPGEKQLLIIIIRAVINESRVTA